MKTDEISFAQLCELFAYTPKNRLLTTAEAAAVLGLRPNTLEISRTHGRGPRFVKPEGSKFVRYTERDLLDYLYAGRFNSTAERSARATASA